MQTDLSVGGPSGLRPFFKWRDRHGVFHSVSDMETRHLFYTLRMIWNHTVAESMQLQPYKKYAFGAFYSPDYMQRAIKHIGQELFTRDIPADFAMQLRQMAANYYKLYSEPMLDASDYDALEALSDA